MITNDMITFIKNDLIIFGSGIFVFMMIYVVYHFQTSALGDNTIIELCFCRYGNDRSACGLIDWLVGNCPSHRTSSVQRLF